MSLSAKIANKSAAIYYFVFVGISLPLVTLVLPRALPVYLVLLSMTAIKSGWDKQKINRNLLCFVGLACGYLFISALWSIQPVESLEKAAKVTTITLLGFFLFSYTKHIPAQYIDILQKGFVYTTILIAFVFLSEYFTNYAIYGYTIENRFPRSLKPGTSLLAIISFLFVLIYFNKNKLLTILLALACLIFLSHISIMKTPFLAITFGLISITCLLYKPKTTLYVLTFFFAGLLFLSPFILSSNITQYSFEYGGGNITSLLHRFAIWDFAINQIVEKPILGYGLGASAYIDGGKQLISAGSLPNAAMNYGNWFILLLTSQAELLPLHPHNMGIQLYLELGVIGTIIAVLLIFAAFNYAKSIANDQLIVMLVILFIMNQSGFSIWQSWWLSFEVILLFLTISFIKNNKTQAKYIN